MSADTPNRRLAAVRGSTARNRVAAYSLLLSGVLVVVLAHWPGNLNVDALGTIAFVRTGMISDQLSPVLTWVWRQAYRVTGLGPGAILALQTVALSGGLYLVLRAAFGRIAAAALAVLALLAPPAFGLVGLVGRDAWFVSACLIATGLAVAAQRWPAGRVRLGALALGATAALVAIAARQNAFTAVAPIMVGLAVPAVAELARGRAHRAWIVRRRRAAALALGVGATIVALAGTVLAGLAVRDKASHPETYTFLYDLGHLSLAENRRFIPRLPRDVQPVQRLAEVREHWLPTSSLPLRLHGAGWFNAIELLRAPAQTPLRIRRFESDGTLGPVEVLADYRDRDAARLASAWRDAVIGHPGAYLAGRMGLWRRSIGIGSPPIGVMSSKLWPNPWGYEEPSFPVLADAARGWTRTWVDPETLTGSDIHRVWPYLLVCLLGTLLLLRRFPAPVRTVGLLMVAVIGLQVGLFFLAPSVELRFHLLAIYGAMIAAAVGIKSVVAQRDAG